MQLSDTSHRLVLWGGTRRLLHTVQLERHYFPNGLGSGGVWGQLPFLHQFLFLFRTRMQLALHFADIPAQGGGGSLRSDCRQHRQH